MRACIHCGDTTGACVNDCGREERHEPADHGVDCMCVDCMSADGVPAAPLDAGDDKPRRVRPSLTWEQFESYFNGGAE